MSFHWGRDLSHLSPTYPHRTGGLGLGVYIFTATNGDVLLAFPPADKGGTQGVTEREKPDRRLCFMRTLLCELYGETRLAWFSQNKSCLGEGL